MVYVLNINGEPLMPTERYGKVRRILKSGRAKVVKRTPFTIQLLYETTNCTQPVTLGVDAGYKHIGLSAMTESKEIYSSEVIERCDIVDLLKTKRECRRTRRNNKTRYRKPRFNNRVRSKHKGWLAPSVEHKIQTHIKVIQNVCSIVPVTKIRIETAEFDVHKIKNPEVQGIGYQQGEKYGFVNTRNYVLWRDNHTCRCCGKSKGVLFVVNAKGITTVAPEDLYTVCKECLDNHIKGIKPLKFKKKRHFAPPTQMGIMRNTLLDRLKNSVNVPVENTYGYVTKGIREEYGINKSHTNDAYCIAGNLQAKRLNEYYLQKKVRCHNRQIHKMNILKGNKKRLKQAPYIVKGYRLNDKVLYDNQICFISGRRTSGYFAIKDIFGKTLSSSVSYKKLRLLETAKHYTLERITR